MFLCGEGSYDHFGQVVRLLKQEVLTLVDVVDDDDGDDGSGDGDGNGDGGEGRDGGDVDGEEEVPSCHSAAAPEKVGDGDAEGSGCGKSGGNGENLN